MLDWVLLDEILWISFDTFVSSLFKKSLKKLTVEDEEGVWFVETAGDDDKLEFEVEVAGDGTGIGIAADGSIGGGSELMNGFDELFEDGRRGGGPAREDEDDEPAAFGTGRNEPGAV